MDCSNYSTVMRMLNHKSEEINMKVIITRMKELMLSSYMRVKDSFCSQHWIKQSKDYIWSNLTRWSEKDHLIDWCTLHKFKIKTQRFQEYLNINDILKMLLLSTDMTIFTFKFTTYLDVNLWLNIITCMWDHRWYLWKNRFGWTNYKLTPEHVIDLSVKMVVSKVFLNWILKATKLP